MSYSETINYDSSASLNFSATNVEVASSTLRLKDLGGGTYTTTAQLVTSQHQNTISSLTSFAESSTVPANTAIGYQLVLNGVAYWYSATLASWTKADGTYATTNSASTINAQASTLFSQLNLLVPQFLALNIWLDTTSSTARPVLTSNTVGYTWTNQNPSAISLVSVTGYLADLVTNIPLPTAAQPVTLLVSCDHAFFHGNHFVEPFTKSFAFSTLDGSVTASIMETATPGVKLNFAVSYYDGQSFKTSRLFSAIVPNQSAINLSNIGTVYPVDFG